jgi:hypothetical protein
MPILPPPPPLFSTMKEPPFASCSAAAMMRAMMSEGPPGVLATTIRTGRSGKAASAEPMRRMTGAAKATASVLLALMKWRRESAFSRLVIVSPKWAFEIRLTVGIHDRWRNLIAPRGVC